MNAFAKAREEVQKEQSKVEMMQIESRHSYQLKSSVWLCDQMSWHLGLGFLEVDSQVRMEVEVV